ncbi:MAG: glycosyltransferase family 2 protein [Patescibacteria group bacterium]|jgi:hypothetical protein
MISFIIVNFNTAEITKDCISSLLSNTSDKDREIIIIDNASVDDSPAILNAAFGGAIKLISNQNNLGFATANNIGARAAKGDILFFLNSDTIVGSDIIGPIIKALDNQKLGIVAPVLLLADGQKQPFAYGRFPRLASVIFNKVLAFDCSRIAGQLKLVDWVSGAALAIRKSVFEKIGGWDERFFLYFEDVDFCWRAKQRGFEIAVLESISIVHLGGRSLVKSRERKKQYYLAQEYFFRKNYGAVSANILKIMRWPYIMIKILTR